MSKSGCCPPQPRHSRHVASQFDAPYTLAQTGVANCSAVAGKETFSWRIFNTRGVIAIGEKNVYVRKFTVHFTALPAVTNTLGTLSVTWTKAASYTGTYGTHFVVETSATLAGPWTTETSPGNVSFPSANEVKYTFPRGTAYTGKLFARLKVTGP